MVCPQKRKILKQFPTKIGVIFDFLLKLYYNNYSKEKGINKMDWIKEMEEKYSKLSNADIFNALLNYINYREETSNYEDMERSTILDEISKRLNI